MPKDASDPGDAALGRALAAAGSAYDPEAVGALVRGVLAAPPAADPPAWRALVAAAPGEKLRAALGRIHAALAAERVPAPPTAGERLAALRAELAARGLDGFMVPRGDEHQGEYVSARSCRLAWLTGFAGSAGAAAVLPARAAVFVDGRYTLQVRQQVDLSLYEIGHLTDQPPTKWLRRALEPSQRLGFAPWLHTERQAEALGKACEQAGASLVACDTNPVDAAWRDQPPPPISPTVPHAIAYSGCEAAVKRAEIAAALAAEQADALVLTQPDSIAWLLNIRGGDVPHTPLPLSFAVLHADDSVQLFIDRRKLAPGIEAHLGKRVAVADPDALGAALDALAGSRVQVDPNTAAAWIFRRLVDAEVVRVADPCSLAKACKNPVELDGARAAHRRDGAALTRFLAWLADAAPAGAVTEIDAAERLESLRRRGERLMDLSFDTISGAGPNGAIVHYRVNEASNRRLTPGELYLVDSGAQYLDGTTDVTRTVAIGTPGAEARDHFTRVLKGHIAMATARFPEGTTGAQLDSFARQYLWQAGLDFDHGTGHGVGSYLGVHEGPQRISKAGSGTALRPGMIVSNEPGYYKEGAYGIRIENLVTVVAAPPPPGAERPLLGFETLTLAPIDLALVEPTLMTAAEIAWLDAYHGRVRAEIGPLVDAETSAWLTLATRPLEE